MPVLLPALKSVMYFLVLSFAFFSNALLAKDQLVVAVGLAKPPYVIQADDSGFELDLIRNLLSKMGKSTKYIYTQFGHSSKMLEVEQVDVVMTTNHSVFSDISKLTDEYITYQNIAISLTDKHLTIDKIEDLANYTIASFQKADIVLGPIFANAVDKSLLYMKIADQSQQPKLLLKNRVDVLIMDINIFNYFARELGIKDIKSRFTFHQIFPKTHYRIAFKDKQLVQPFNDVLAQFKLTEEYQLLQKSYGL